MRVYQVSFRRGAFPDVGTEGEHLGYEYFRSKREARRAIAEARSEGNLADFALSPQFPPNGSGIMQALKKFAEHPDNG